MKEFFVTLGFLLIAFGAVKLVIALIQRHRRGQDGKGEV